MDYSQVDFASLDIDALKLAVTDLASQYDAACADEDAKRTALKNAVDARSSVNGYLDQAKSALTSLVLAT